MKGKCLGILSWQSLKAQVADEWQQFVAKSTLTDNLKNSWVEVRADDVHEVVVAGGKMPREKLPLRDN